MARSLADLVPKELLDRVRRGVALVEGVTHVRILGHYDPDGTTSAAVLARAMTRAGKAFHASTSTVIDVSHPKISTTFTHAVYFPFFGYTYC